MKERSKSYLSHNPLIPGLRMGFVGALHCWQADNQYSACKKDNRKFQLPHELQREGLGVPHAIGCHLHERMSVQESASLTDISWMTSDCESVYQRLTVINYNKPVIRLYEAYHQPTIISLHAKLRKILRTTRV